MNCCLWLNGKKVRCASEILDNFDVCSLAGYYIAGSLIPWLKSNGGSEFAAALSALTPAGDFSAVKEQLYFAFGIKRELPVVLQLATAENGYISAKPLCASSFFGGLSSFSAGSFGAGILTSSQSSFSESFSSGSFFSGSFGSFVLMGTNITPQEAEKVRSCISSCPLNRYGYGLHLI